eukprot:scaffold31_cov98-Skeletonema_dohrnii-CCMP3373.AAC.5
MVQPKHSFDREFTEEHEELVQHDVFTHKLRRTESYVGRPHSPATAATWGRYLFNPATSHTLYAAAPPIHTLCVTTNEDRKNFAQCFVSFAKGSSSHAVPPSIQDGLIFSETTLAN